MSMPLVLGFLWVVAATIVAFLPMRMQVVFGFGLAISAIILIGWLSVTVAPWVGVVALAAFVSMFRRPLVYLVRRYFGRGGPT